MNKMFGLLGSLVRKHDFVCAIFILFWANGVQSQLCVLPGTCSVNTTTPTGGVIDIRIVTPGQTVPPAIVTPLPTTCPTGLVPCSGTVVPQCGVQYVTPVATADGATTAGSQPWQAFIMNQTGYTGSGVLLDQYHVLTAAHKVNSNVQTPTNIRIFLGVWDPSTFTGVVNRTAVRILVHPSFNPNTLFNDIAIIRLDTPVPLGVSPTVNIGCLPAQGASYVGRSCIVAGWGQSQFSIYDSPTRPQRQVTIPIVPYANCRTSLSATSIGTQIDMYLDPVGEICAGGNANQDACTNDGGAPLMCTDPTTGRYTVAGLVLWGKGCGQSGVYGVYNNVAYYRTWIDSTIATSNAG